MPALFGGNFGRNPKSERRGDSVEDSNMGILPSRGSQEAAPGEWPVHLENRADRVWGRAAEQAHRVTSGRRCRFPGSSGACLAASRSSENIVGCFEGALNFCFKNRSVTKLRQLSDRGQSIFGKV